MRQGKRKPRFISKSGTIKILSCSKDLGAEQVYAKLLQPFTGNGDVSTAKLGYSGFQGTKENLRYDHYSLLFMKFYWWGGGLK
jgi:hypothetical protein